MSRRNAPQTPVKKRKFERLTPAEEERQEEVHIRSKKRTTDLKDDGPSKKLDFDVPFAINKLLEYARKGESTVSKSKSKLVTFIETHAEIPSDFEQHHKYGPKSGSTYEDRLIHAFIYELLPLSVEAEDVRPRVKKFIKSRNFDQAAACLATTDL